MRVRVVVASGVALLGLLALVGCGADGGLRAVVRPPTKPNLTIFGDSIAAISKPQLHAPLDADYRVTIAAVHGIGTKGMTSRIEAAAVDPPAIVVIELGTNDAGCGHRCIGTSSGPRFEAGEVNARYDRFAKLFPTSTCTIFVNVSTHASSWRSKNAAQINQHLATFPRVVDWDGAWHPAWFDNPADVHPNLAGREALAGLIADKAATCPSSQRVPVPTTTSSVSSNGSSGVPPTTMRTSGRTIVPLRRDGKRRTLQFFGDSITVKSTDALLAEFSPHFQVGFNALGGATTGWYTRKVAADTHDPPDVVVINLGTNDAACQHGRCDGSDGIRARPDFDAQVVNANFDAFRRGYPASTCVVFVNVSTHNPVWGEQNAAEIDAHLAAFPRVVDWNRAWQREWFDSLGTPHPNAVGQRALAELIAVQISTCPVADT